MAYATTAGLYGRIPQAETPPPGVLAPAWATAVAYALADAETQIDDERFGLRTEYAHVMLTAHILAVRFPLSGVGLSAGGGVVASMSAAEISVSYAVRAATDGDSHSSTKFGQEFDNIARGITAFPTCVGG